MMDFEGRVAVVTGAGRGIGRSHALLLAARGASVVVNDLGVAMDGTSVGASPADDVVAEIRAGGGRAVADRSSVTTTRGARAIVQAAIDVFGGLDIVVNNAGIVPPHQFPSTGPADLQRNLDVHLLGSFNVTRAAWQHLVRSDAARVVMTTSSVVLGERDLIAYGSAKGGVLALGRGLAHLGASVGVSVNMVAPLAKTRMSDPDPVYELLLPEQVSAVVTYLAHESCQLNGEILSCGGGRVARILLAETQGYGLSTLTPEDVAANLDTICDPSDCFVPQNLDDYIEFFMDRVLANSRSGRS